MKEKIKSVVAQLVVEGTHYWSGCDIDEVSYLRYPHRHLFHIKCVKQVTHSDRDIEFIKLKHEIHDYLISQYYNPNLKLCEFKQMSCEMIAEELIDKFDLNRCDVFEDGENGASVLVS